MSACQLRLHEGKTKTVFCKKINRQSSSKTVKFDFLGYSFQPRLSATKGGRMFLGYDCAISQSSRNRIISEIKSTKFQRWTNRSIGDIAEFFNTEIQGWINYYGKIRKYKLIRYFVFLKGDSLSGQDGGISVLTSPISKRVNGFSDSRGIMLDCLFIGKEDLETCNFMYNKSRMMVDYHVRFCGRFGAKLPLPT